MGSVWLAEHLTLRSQVAVKLMDPSIAASPEGADRFRREAQAAASLRSAHVVQVLDYGVDEGMPFLVMELLQGENLGVCLEREQRLPPERTLSIMTQVARAVGRAHSANIVHRDLKPDNVFLVNEDGHEVVKVLDFGIAKTREPSFGGLETRTGVTMGTPYYMSPEQAEGKKAVDHRTDLWAMAVITCECLTGQRPFRGETWGELLLNICARPIPVPSTEGPVPPEFDTWFARATSRDIDQRFNSAQEFIASLCECLDRSGKPPLATGGRVWGQKGGTVAHNGGPIVALPPITGPTGQITGPTGDSSTTGNTARGHSLEVSTTETGARKRSLLVPISIALTVLLFVAGGALAAGFGLWTFLRGREAGTLASVSSAPTGGAPALDSATGGSPSRDQPPDSNIAGSPPSIVPAQGGNSPFDGLLNKPGSDAEPPRPRDDGARPKPAPSAPASPPGGVGGRPPSDAARTVQCFTDPFTGAVRLIAKGRVPTGAAVYPCKQNPFTGQYQKLK
jgi:serine/threonine-protein kinase